MNMKISSLKDILADRSVVSKFSLVNKGKQKQDKYKNLMRGVNISSYSTNSLLNACEKKFAIQKLELAQRFISGSEGFVTEENIDFAFGKAIETGVHSVFLGESSEKILLDMFLAWDIPIFTEHEKNYPKNFIDALIAIDKFKNIYKILFAGWEVAQFNGKPAIELSMCIDLENGFFYVGHIDVILYSPLEQRYRILEIKTSGAKHLHEALYKNSDQAVGYSIPLDTITHDQEASRSFEIFYLVWSTVKDDWVLFQFTKSRAMRAEWLNTLLQDNQRTQMHIKTEHWPKRGATCTAYNRVCARIDTCDLSFTAFKQDGKFDWISKEEVEDNDVHTFDMRFKISQIINTQQELL